MYYQQTPLKMAKEVAESASDNRRYGEFVYALTRLKEKDLEYSKNS